MISINEALEIIKSKTSPRESERISLFQAIGRVLAEDIFADMDLPPFDRSQMDGFAVRSKDLKKNPVDLKLIGESVAGKGFKDELKPFETVRIMTGAPVPKGADAVQKVELIEENGERIVFLESVKKGHFITPKGSEIKKGEKVFEKGEKIDEKMIAALASFGYAEVKVYKKPKVAILATGSEIVEINKKPKQDQIRDSNSAMLKVFAESCNAEVEVLPLVKDEVKLLQNQIDNALKTNDILIITGGVSVGKYDFTKEVLRNLGAEIYFDKVSLKPGKPTVFGKLNDKLIFGLPGNPVSVAVTFQLFVRTALFLAQNAIKSDLKKGFARLKNPVRGTKERDSFLPGVFEIDENGILTAELLPWSGSSNFIAFAKAQILLFIPKGKSFERGETVKIIFL